MRSRVGILLAAVATLALSSVSVAADKGGKGGDPVGATEGKVTLTYDSGKSVTCLTPQWAKGGKQMSAKGSMGKASISGKSLSTAGWKSGAGYRIGLDTNGDGIVNSQEYRNVFPGGSVVLTGKVDGREISVRCVDVLVHYDEKKNEVSSMRWRMQGVYGWVGKIDSVKIRILDENLSGKYEQNGTDAIQIGNGKLALPFRGRHRIGENFYKLKIAPDGSSLEYTKIPDPQAGLVLTPFTGKYLAGLVLEGQNGAYDIQACSQTGIPAGSYEVVYGAVGDLRAPMSLSRGRERLKYEIQADKKNLIRIGPPLKLVFSASYSESKKDKDDKHNKQVTRRLSISIPRSITGAGGEEYGPVSFPNARSPKGRPAVMILQGSKTLVKAAMPERDGKVQNYSWELRRTLSLRGIRVVMAAPVRGIGKVMGVKTIQEIVSKKAPEPKKTDKPSVITTPWKKPGRPVKIAKKTKPPVGVKPRPATRPSTVTRPIKPPKPAATNEQKAERLVKLAESYDKMKMRAKSIKILTQTIKEYPGTKAAIAAKVLLAAMQ